VNKQPRVLVIGSANIDLIMRIARLPNRGELLTDSKFSTACGGKGANQAVALARLGADVEFIGRVGEDPFGEILLQNLENEGVSISRIVRDSEYHAGTVSILVDAGGENTMIADFGSNLQLCPDDIERAADSIRKADLMLLQGEVPESANLCAVSFAKDSNIPIIVNPAPMSLSSVDMLKGSYLITPNLVEAEALAGLAGKELFAETDPFKKAEEAAQFLIDAGIERIVVTIGSQGSVYVSSDIKKPFGTFPTNQVDATGAGDAFTAAIAYGIATGQSIEDSIGFASATSAIAVSRLGAQPSFPTIEEVQAFLDLHTFKAGLEC
jgi:ribokinase